MNIEQAKEHLYKLQRAIEPFKERGFFIQDIESSNEKERFEARLTENIIEQLYDIEKLIRTINQDIRFEGTLTLGEDGRYWIEGYEHYYTSGSPIIYYNEDWEEWLLSTVESKNGEYYIVGTRDLDMQGVRVQVRG